MKKVVPILRDHPKASASVALNAMLISALTYFGSTLEPTDHDDCEAEIQAVRARYKTIIEKNQLRYRHGLGPVFE